ncbi:MAG: glucose 1-dehydrogenase [Pseudomonadales bacterium]|nr:glucose 1-dehydrogenase [Pseudomonadales bacterium]
MGRVANKVALISGGAMGLGKASAERLAFEGASVVITDIADKEGQAAADQINEEGGKALFIHHDVSQETEWVSVIEQTLAHFGALHILVNNAGIALSGTVLDMSMADYHKQNSINLDGVFLGMKYSIPAIAQSGGGSIINISSVAGIKGAPGLSAYAMTKGGVRLLSKSVARECIEMGNNIRVNSIHPGIIETAIWDKLGGDNVGENRARISEAAESVIPGGKIGQPLDIANGVLFLASEDASYMTGSELVIDHGFTA